MATASEPGRARPVREPSPIGTAVSIARTTLQVAGGLAIVAGVTFVCFRLLRGNAITAGFAYLLAVLLVATLWGLLESVVAWIAAVFSFNFFFLPPIFTLTVSDPQTWRAFFDLALT